MTLNVAAQQRASASSDQCACSAACNRITKEAATYATNDQTSRAAASMAIGVAVSAPAIIGLTISIVPIVPVVMVVMAIVVPVVVASAAAGTVRTGSAKQIVASHRTILGNVTLL